ncbi:polyphenol oxidase A1, chloroplastic-like [Papaver somniferum]|uniref:polyphenol oxidase A1, chloroplastic-like n=1 Tax=Papaver somniferum TaxID=3469 RepID=UPI000E703EB1|nr:polyphenol oxidase A1, chloroplastic-like [Papaver somniferum]
MSLSHLCTTPICSSITSNNPLRSASTKLSTPSVRLSNPTATISCEHNKQTSRNEASNVTQHVVDRRNVLLGLGGLYGAAGASIGAPLTPPDLTKCHKATDQNTTPHEVDCCPPDYGTAKMVDFTPPSPNDPLRVRKAAHKYNLDDIAKFEAAVAKMKALPTNHPWNYYQQATIHCTYCNGAFNQLNTKTLLQVHGRMYMPPMYLNEKSPLFYEIRNKNHYKSVLDYNYSMGADIPTDTKAVVTNNDDDDDDDEDEE